MTAHITNGMLFDPFSLMATGFVRKNRKPKISVDTDPLYYGLHSEAKFKAAFVNACHFAESMTVIGPIGSISWDDFSSSNIMEPALRWPLDLNRPNNADIAKQFTSFLTNNGWNGVDSERYYDPARQKFMLSAVPDLALSGLAPRLDEELTDSRWGATHRWGSHFYDESYFGNTRNKTLASGEKAQFTTGMPMLGVMAIVFTFKKPQGDLAVTELTNLGSWPPVVFMIPVLLPAGASFMSEMEYGNAGNLLRRQPSISTYRIALTKETNIIPFGQPFKLYSVGSQGKTPDILRSLSDVFKALWSQATLYSAWNMKFSFDPLNPTKRDSIVGDLFLEPIGAGRRIRGHNRFHSKYDLQNVMMLSQHPTTGEVISHVVSSAIHKGLYTRQPSSSGHKKEAIFVLPSYFSDDSTKAFRPLAHAVSQFMFNSDTGLEVFLDGSVGYPTPSRFTFTKSYADYMFMAMGIEDLRNVGGRPVHRIAPSIEFDPVGDPTVFGLRFGELAMDKMEMASVAEQPPSTYEEIVAETEVLENFKFLDSFTSASPQDLSNTFKAVKEPKKRGKKAVVNEERINLFDEVEDMF